MRRLRARRSFSPEREPVADEQTVAKVAAAGEGYDYLLAVGAGTLNDLCKYAGFLTHRESGVFATAPSMDGFSSGVTPLIEKGFKITPFGADGVRRAHRSRRAVRRAPHHDRRGRGGYPCKYCCLTDWRISSYLTGETYGEEAASLMYDAVRACDESIPALAAGREEGVGKLMEALLISGYAMVIAGNSRPASGAEHHMSHFLEMDFLRRGERIPLHGVKVGLGDDGLPLSSTRRSAAVPPSRAASASMPRRTSSLRPSTSRASFLRSAVRRAFPRSASLRRTVRTMFFEAYKIRDRFTVLTLYCTKGWMKETADELMERFF